MGIPLMGRPVRPDLGWKKVGSLGWSLRDRLINCGCSHHSSCQHFEGTPTSFRSAKVWPVADGCGSKFRALSKPW